jgi:hypothetical protein
MTGFAYKLPFAHKFVGLPHKSPQTQIKIERQYSSYTAQCQRGDPLTASRLTT